MRRSKQNYTNNLTNVNIVMYNNEIQKSVNNYDKIDFQFEDLTSNFKENEVLEDIDRLVDDLLMSKMIEKIDSEIKNY